MRQSWDWLHTWVHPDEAMLARLWSARRIDLHYPASRTVDMVRATWLDYLGSQWWRHLVWLAVNGFIAPFAFLLFVLPGPNLIGYWFFYRAIHHSLVIWGITRVRRNKVPTEMYPVAALDLPIEHDDVGKSRHGVLTAKATRLDDHVTWHDARRRGTVTREPSAPPSPSEPELANSSADEARDR